jgi:hypothetical protein
MKARNREINIFSLSLMDVISGAMGAFLIVAVMLARFSAVDQEKHKDSEKLRARLDAAMQALADVRAGTEKTFAQDYVKNVKPKTLGLSAGETVAEITALGRALRTDIDRIDGGLAEALHERGAAVRALATASGGTEKIFKERLGVKPETLGLSRGNSVHEIGRLGQALRSDIDTIGKGVAVLLQENGAAKVALVTASFGTEKIFKDRIDDAKPATQGLIRGLSTGSVPEIKKLGQALQSDIDTIYKELQKRKATATDVPIFVTMSSQCDDKSSVKLEIASDETNPATGKPYPPYNPSKDQRYSGGYTMLGTGGLKTAYMFPRPLPGTHYKIYLYHYGGPCWAVVGTLSGNKVIKRLGAIDVMDELYRNDQAGFQAAQVSLFMKHDYIFSKPGLKQPRIGVYYFGTITVDEDRNVTFTVVSEKDRDAEMKAMKERVDLSLSNHTDTKNQQ